MNAISIYPSPYHCLVLTAAALLLGDPSAASTSNRLARLSVDVTVEGYSKWSRGSEYANSTISERYHLVTHVQSSGEPSDINPKDPHVLQQQLAMATQVQQSQLTCGSDVNCMMRVAQDYALQSAVAGYSDPALPAESANYGQDARVARYLDYYGYEGCPGEIHIVIDNKSEGATADVSGMVPFQQADTADYRGSELNLMMQCLASTLVYDLETKKIYTDGIGHPAPRGSYRYWDRLHGETLKNDVDVTTRADAWAWVAQTLRVADASGSASISLPVVPETSNSAGDGSTTTGEVDVRMSWEFEPL